MRVLITGASGFIGSRLIEQLAETQHECVALLRKTSSRRNLEGLTYSEVISSLDDKESLKKAVEGVDAIVHLAGLTSAPNRDAYFKGNAQGCANLAEAVLETKTQLKHFILVSSLAAGGPVVQSTPRIEGDRDQPVSAYGESKLAGEKELLKYADQIPLTIIRPPMVYGPKDRDVFLLIKTVNSRLMPIIKGKTPSGDKFYSIVHVDDLNGSIRAVLDFETPQWKSGEVFYVTGDESTSYRDLLKTISLSLDRKAFQIPVPTRVIDAMGKENSFVGKILRNAFDLTPDKANELRADYWICSNQKAKEVLKFEPRYNLNTGMRQTIDWYRSNAWL